MQLYGRLLSFSIGGKNIMQDKNNTCKSIVN